MRCLSVRQYTLVVVHGIDDGRLRVVVELGFAEGLIGAPWWWRSSSR